MKGIVDINTLLEYYGIESEDFDDLINDGYIVEENVDRVFSFEIGNEKYYYKTSDYDYVPISPYSELIAEELLKDFNLPCVEYNLATLCKTTGVISKDFHKKNATYISGKKLLKDKFKCHDLFIYEHNNLEDIWDSLLYYFRDNNDRSMIVANLMSKIVDLFIFDILTNNSDRNATNWQIECIDNHYDLAPVFDNERIMINNISNPTVALAVDGNAPQGTYDSIIDFINTSSDDFYNRIVDKMWIICQNNLENVFKRIEEKTQVEVPLDVRKHYLEKFKCHEDILNGIIEELKVRKR